MPQQLIYGYTNRYIRLHCAGTPLIFDKLCPYFKLTVVIMLLQLLLLYDLNFKPQMYVKFS
jgi:hypothetical protein